MAETQTPHAETNPNDVVRHRRKRGTRPAAGPNDVVSHRANGNNDPRLAAHEAPAGYTGRHEQKEKRGWKAKAEKMRKIGGKALDLGVSAYATVVYGRAVKGHVDAVLAEHEAAAQAEHAARVQREQAEAEQRRADYEQAMHPGASANISRPMHPEAAPVDQAIDHGSELATDGDVLVTSSSVENTGDLDLPAVEADAVVAEPVAGLPENLEHGTDYAAESDDLAAAAAEASATTPEPASVINHGSPRHEAPASIRRRGLRHGLRSQQRLFDRAHAAGRHSVHS